MSRRSGVRSMLVAWVIACGCDSTTPREAPDASSAVDASAGNDAERDATIDAGLDATEPTEDASAPIDDADRPDLRVDPEPGVVETDRGLVRGVERGGTRAYLGIPYARPPIGDLRFRPPEPAEPWDGVRDGSAYGSACRQIYYDGSRIGDEDCLTLNVWTPSEAPAAPLPVMVYLHGGDNVYGWSGEGDYYDGEVLVGERDVVLVTVNYRLGPAGFLAHPAFRAENEHGATGNWALHDQIAALAWVQRNAAAFGGDAGRVMLFGQSAGASDTCALLASPLARGLFHSALMQSLNCEAYSVAEVEPTWRDAQTSLGCDGASDVAACLRAADADALADLPHNGHEDVDYYVNVDGWVLPEDPVDTIRAGRHAHMPVIVGTTEDEYSQITYGIIGLSVPTAETYPQVLRELFGEELGPMLEALYPLSDHPSARWALANLLGDYIMSCPTRRVARALRDSQTEPVWRYYYAHDPRFLPLSMYGAAHGYEVPFVFGTFDGAPSADERRLSEAMMDAWTGLARDGAPGAPEGFGWPRYDAAESMARLDWPLATAVFPRQAQCDFWDSLEE